MVTGNTMALFGHSSIPTFKCWTQTCLRWCTRVARLSCPELAATSSAVKPCSVTAFMSHPTVQRHLTSSEWPYLAARWRGVAPFYSCSEWRRGRGKINDWVWLHAALVCRGMSCVLWAGMWRGLLHVQKPYSLLLISFTMVTPRRRLGKVEHRSTYIIRDVA